VAIGVGNAGSIICRCDSWETNSACADSYALLRLLGGGGGRGIGGTTSRGSCMWARSARRTCGVDVSDIPRVPVGLDPSYAVESWLDCSE
jgi:hypothetical protein